MKVLVWKDKHCDHYYDASTDEALEKSAVKVLKQLMEYSYIYKPEDPMDHIEYSGIDLEQAQLTDEQIAALPTDGLREEARKHKAKFAQRFKRHESEMAEYREIEKIIAGETVMSPDWVRQADSRDGKHKKGDVMPGRPVTAWSILQGRNGAEYEVFEIEHVEMADD